MQLPCIVITGASWKGYAERVTNSIGLCYTNLPKTLNYHCGLKESTTGKRILDSDRKNFKRNTEAFYETNFFHLVNSHQ